MEDNYPKAYKEVIEILKYIPEKSVKKIPQTILDTFKAKMDEEHGFTVDTNKSFEEQTLLEETKAILANIFRDYWATPYQKERIEAKEKYDRQKDEKEKRDKHNPKDIFIQRDKVSVKESIEQTNTTNISIKAKKEKFYERIKNLLKKFFKF